MNCINLSPDNVLIEIMINMDFLTLVNFALAYPRVMSLAIPMLRIHIARTFNYPFTFVHYRGIMGLILKDTFINMPCCFCGGNMYVVQTRLDFSINPTVSEVVGCTDCYGECGTKIAVINGKYSLFIKTGRASDLSIHSIPLEDIINITHIV